MAITYTWLDAEQTSLKYVDDSTDPETVLYIPVDTGNSDYNEYLASGITAGDYVEPVIVDPGPTELELLTARVSAIESNEISDDSVDASLLTLIADLTTRVQALEGGN
jgi:hypothetical protein